MFIYTLCLVLLLTYEVQKLMQFHFFFRLKCIKNDYTNLFKTKNKSAAFKDSLKISLIEILYVIILFIGIILMTGSGDSFFGWALSPLTQYSKPGQQ